MSTVTPMAPAVDARKDWLRAALRRVVAGAVATRRVGAAAAIAPAGAAAVPMAVTTTRRATAVVTARPTGDRAALPAIDAASVSPRPTARVVRQHLRSCAVSDE